MPLLAYFAIVGPILLGLMFWSDAVLGPPNGLAISTAWNGLPKANHPQTAGLASRYDHYRPIPFSADAAAAFASVEARDLELSARSKAPVELVSQRTPGKLARKDRAKTRFAERHQADHSAASQDENFSRGW